MKWFSIDVPAGWGALGVRTVNTAVIAFVILQLKEYKDAGMFDTPGTGADALLIAAGVFLINALFRRRTS